MEEIPARLSITECIQLSMVSRATFYRKYIDTGKISFKTDNSGKKYIEGVELLRAIPDITLSHEETPEPVSVDTVRYAESLAKIDLLGLELKLVREQLTDARQQIQDGKEREADLKTLLAQARPPEQKQISWWGRLTGKK